MKGAGGEALQGGLVPHAAIANLDFAALHGIDVVPVAARLQVQREVPARHAAGTCTRWARVPGRLSSPPAKQQPLECSLQRLFCSQSIHAGAEWRLSMMTARSQCLRLGSKP